MNKTIIILISALVFLGGFLFFYDLKDTSDQTQKRSDVSVPSQKLETKIDNQASVTVAVTPSELLAESKEWKFNIVMDTHSVELDLDMTTVAVIVDDFGKEHRPVRWEGAGVGGHHREGVLTFDQITPLPNSIELKIFDIGDVVRSFVWEME